MSSHSKPLRLCPRPWRKRLDVPPRIEDLINEAQNEIELEVEWKRKYDNYISFNIDDSSMDSWGGPDEVIKKFKKAMPDILTIGLHSNPAMFGVYLSARIRGVRPTKGELAKANKEKR